MIEKQIVAAFDFDGTITSRDTLLPFLIYAKGLWKTLPLFTRLSPSLIKYLINFHSRQKTKEDALTLFFKGKPITDFLELGTTFAHSKTLNQLVLPAALECIRWHQSQGHRCIVISAAIDTYISPWSQHMGFNDYISSRIESINGKVTGKLVGLNCWGPEKVRRLTELLGPKENYTLYAYGDSTGDRDLLALADYPHYRKF